MDAQSAQDLHKYRAGITVSQAAEQLGVTERMVINNIQDHKLKAFRIGKRWFIYPKSLESFVAAKKKAKL